MDPPPPLRVLAEQLLRTHWAGVRDVGDCPYSLLSNLLPLSTATQLRQLEHLSPHLVPWTDSIWRDLCIKDFIDVRIQVEDGKVKPHDVESWRDRYDVEEGRKEAKLNQVLSRLRDQYSTIDATRQARQIQSVDGLRLEKRRKLTSGGGGSSTGGGSRPKTLFDKARSSTKAITSIYAPRRVKVFGTSGSRAGSGSGTGTANGSRATFAQKLSDPVKSTLAEKREEKEKEKEKERERIRIRRERERDEAARQVDKEREEEGEERKANGQGGPSTALDHSRRTPKVATAPSTSTVHPPLPLRGPSRSAWTGDAATDASTTPSTKMNGQSSTRPKAPVPDRSSGTAGSDAARPPASTSSAAASVKRPVTVIKTVTRKRVLAPPCSTLPPGSATASTASYSSSEYPSNASTSSASSSRHHSFSPPPLASPSSTPLFSPSTTTSSNRPIARLPHSLSQSQSRPSPTTTAHLCDTNRSPPSSTAGSPPPACSSSSNALSPSVNAAITGRQSLGPTTGKHVNGGPSRGFGAGGGGRAQVPKGLFMPKKR